MGHYRAGGIIQSRYLLLKSVSNCSHVPSINSIKCRLFYSKVTRTSGNCLIRASVKYYTEKNLIEPTDDLLYSKTNKILNADPTIVAKF